MIDDGTTQYLYIPNQTNLPLSTLMLHLCIKILYTDAPNAATTPLHLLNLYKCDAFIFLSRYFCQWNVRFEAQRDVNLSTVDL